MLPLGHEDLPDPLAEMRAYYDALEDRDFDGWGWSSSGLAFLDDPAEGGGV